VAKGVNMNESREVRSHLLHLSLLIALSFLVGLTPPLFSQASPVPLQPKRIKVGVALEGGGALGLAHIGVLRWFELHHIPVDVIAGNSMGGLVGGLYASGKSPDELEALVNNLDWQMIIGGTTPYSDLSFRRKEDSRAIPDGLHIGFKEGVSLPSALNSGHQIKLVLDRETLPYATLRSFDDLPIPFRCVSTDLTTGKAHVFHDGSLSVAMRSSMSLPAIFAPIRDGDHLYVDGMLVDNLPTDLVRAMGPDVVIAIHLQIAPTTADQIRSLFSVLGRSMTIGSANTELKGMEEADLVVNVNVQKFGAMDFSRAQELIEIGMKAAEAKATILLPYALDDAAWSRYIADRNARKITKVGIPQFVTVVGASDEMNRRVETYFKSMVGKPIDVAKLEGDLTRLTGVGRFDSASYSLIKKDDEVGLLITIHESLTAPPLLQTAFAVNGDQPDHVTFTLAGRYTMLDVAGFRSELRTDFQFGNTYGIATEFYKPFSQTKKWFFAPRFAANKTSESIYSDGDPTADYRLSQAKLGLDVGYSISRFSEVRVGYEFGYLSARLQLGTPQFDTISGEARATRLRYTIEHTDDPVIPRRGYLAQLNFRWFDKSPAATEAFPSLDFRGEIFKPISRPTSLFFTTQAGTTMGYANTGIPQFFLGGTSGWYAYGQNEIRGNEFYLFRAGFTHNLFNMPPFFGSGLYAISFYEGGKMFGAPGISRFPNDGAVGVIARTVIGPVLLGGSVGDDGHAKWFFALGRVF
jgi:NTE family protein